MLLIGLTDLHLNKFGDASQFKKLLLHERDYLSEALFTVSGTYKYDNRDDAASVGISYEFISVIIQKKKQTHVN